MAKKSISSRRGLSRWLAPGTYFDGWFALLERTRSAMRRLLDVGFLFKDRSPRARLSFLPQVEGLEMRTLMTQVFFSTATQSVNYNATAIVEVDLDSSSGQTVSVAYHTTNGTATSGTDYMSTGGSLIFQPGVTSQTFTIPMLDFKESSNKTFTTTLTSPSHATLGSPQTDTVTIVETLLTTSVVDTKTDVVLPPNSPVNTPINTFANWTMSPAAEISGATVATYSWSLSVPSYAGSISSSGTYNPSFTWSSFSGAARSDTLTVTVTATISGSGGSEQLTQSYNFKITGTGSPAYNATEPTSSATWPTVIAPDKLAGQDMQAAGPYAEVGLVDGSAQTQFSLPSYNPNATPLGLVYNSAVADPNPIFQVDYQLKPTATVPTSVTAQLTLANESGTTEYTGSTVYFSPSLLNKGNTMDLALQATGLTMATGRYKWQIVVVANYSPTSTMTYSGSFNFINGSTTPDSVTSSPFGAGWSLANVEQLFPTSVTGTTLGAMLQNPDGTSLWYNGTSYSAPAGDFSTLSLTGSVYTRTMPDGSKYKFNSSGQETNFVDPNGNTTTFAYDLTTQELTAVEDMNSKTSTITYNTSGASNGLAATIASPDGRTLTLTYSSVDLTSIVDPNGKTWTYGYDGSNRLTSLKDPRTGTSYTTSFSYNYASEDTSVTQPDTTTKSFVAEQLAGLPASGTGTSLGNAAAGVLAAAAFATYTDPNSKVWTEYFDGLGLGLPVESVDPLGDTALTYRDANGLPWLSADPLGYRDRLFFDSLGDIVTFVYADDTDWTATYNSLGEPTQVTDPTGGVTTYSYDANGNLLTVEDPLSHTTSYTYFSNGLLQTVEDARSNFTTYAYDPVNRLSTVTDALSNTQTWSYDTTYGNLSAYTELNGTLTIATTYSYSVLNELLSETRPDTTGVSSTYTYTYDAVGNPATAVVPLTSGVSATTTFAYDSMNRLTQVTDPLTHATTYNFDSAGNLTGVVNALGYTTTYAVDSAGRLTAVTVPLTSSTSATTTYTLDAAGEVTAAKNPLSQVTNYLYTARGWLLEVINPLTDTTVYATNQVGDLTGVTEIDTASHTISTSASYFTGPLHLLHTTTNAVGDVTTYSYDAANNLTDVTDFDTNSTDYSYDALNRVQSKTINSVATTSYAYDGVGNVTTVTDPLSHVTTMAYDGQGRLLTTTDPLSKVTTFAYDLAGRQTSVTDPDANVTTYTYNAAGMLTNTENPNTYNATYSYDAIGELTSVTDFAGRQTTYSYNRAGWQTGETAVSGSYTATYSYDSAGELTAAADSNSTYTFTYYNNGQVHQTQVSYPGASGMGTVTLTYGYDGFGNRTSLTDGAGGTIAYTYNSNAQMTALNFTKSTITADVAFSYGTTSNSVDLLTGMTMSGGSDTLSAAYSYGDTSLSITYSDTSLNTLPAFSYTLNGDGQVTQYVGPEGTVTYTYDADGQLTAVGDAESYTYAFDSNGNRNTSNNGTATTTYTTSTDNELTYTTGGSAATLTYDHNGNLSTKVDGAGDTWTYTWDYRNRLTEVVETGTSTLTENLTYDVFNNLIGVKVNGTVQRSTVFDGQNPYMDFNSSGTLTTRYLTNPHAIDQFFGHVSAGGTVLWYLTDMSGSIREVIDGNGDASSIDQITYDPFGNKITESGPGSTDRFRFDGGEWDSNLALYRFGARWNDPVNGRWISQDPVGFAGGDANLYRFIDNGPGVLTDPTGETGSVDGIIASVAGQFADFVAPVLDWFSGITTSVLTGTESLLTGTAQQLNPFPQIPPIPRSTGPLATALGIPLPFDIAGNGLSSNFNLPLLANWQVQMSGWAGLGASQLNNLGSVPPNQTNVSLTNNGIPVVSAGAQVNQNQVTAGLYFDTNNLLGIPGTVGVGYSTSGGPNLTSFVPLAADTNSVVGVQTTVSAINGTTSVNNSLRAQLVGDTGNTLQAGIGSVETIDPQGRTTVQLSAGLGFASSIFSFGAEYHPPSGTMIPVGSASGQWGGVTIYGSVNTGALLNAIGNGLRSILPQ